MLTAMGYADESRLADAVADAGLRVMNGMEPSAAVAKAALAHNLGLEFAKRACEVTNIRLTTDHLAANRENGEKRAASFSLADAAEVARLVEAEMKPEAKAAFVGPLRRDYASVPPSGESYPEHLPEEPPPSAAQTLQMEMDGVRVKVAMIEGHASRCEVDLLEADMDRDAALGGFVQDMNQSGAYDFVAFAKEAVSRHGDGVKAFLLALDERIEQEFPRRSVALSKRASSDFDRILAAARKRVEKAAELERAREALGNGRRKLAELLEKARVENHIGTVREKLAAVAEGNRESEPPTYKPEATFLRHLRDIRRRSAMARMMADPVVGSGEYTPDELNDAYTTVVGLVPPVADNHALLIPQLRQYLESSGNRMGRVMAPQEAGLMASTVSSVDTANRNLDNTLSGLGKDIL